MVDGGKRSFLDSIPGWSGYRDREQRRESDRLLRERLARDYGEIADRLGRLAARLAEDRKLRSIRYVDSPHGRLTHFTDRLKSATYGYAGLFSDRPVDAAALNQIRAFDESLGDGIGELRAAADTLADTDPDSPEFRDRSEELGELIEKLLDRLDRRGELIESGAPRPETEITALLATTSTQPVTPTAYQLHDGDGITHDNENYTIVGRITIETEIASWRDFQLKGGDGTSWLRVPADPSAPFYWMSRVSIEEQAGTPSLNVGGETYALAASVEGTAEVIGSGGGSGDRSVTIHTYSQASGNGVLSVYHWRADEISLLGEPIEADNLEIWSREGGQAI